MKILVLNTGSSSIKFELIDVDQDLRLAEGSVERIGEANATLNFLSKLSNSSEIQPREELAAVPDHHHGLQHSLKLLIESGIIQDVSDLGGIGHRIVHGGDVFSAPVIIDEDVLNNIRGLAKLAPLHNPAAIAGIEVASQLAPEVPQVAVFDTAFHHTLPPVARCYALPPEFQQLGMQRYGFHGTSHSYVCRRTAEELRYAKDEVNLITLHLGNGASITAIRNGQSVDTSMGFTPLEGLVMGTRSGDIDPAIPLYLIQHAGYTAAQVDELLNRSSGLKGLCGVNDMREILARIERGDTDAKLALSVFCYRIRKYIGAYFAILGRPDALVFTAGIGEYSPEVRQMCCRNLQHMGINIDDELNRKTIGKTAQINSADSPVKILVIPTDEELEIAYATRDCLQQMK